MELITNALSQFAAACNPDQASRSFLGLPTWYKYLDATTEAGQCSVAFEFPDDIGKVALAIVEILLRIGGVVAVVFIIYGGFMYITSQGEPDKAKNARQSIINALIGLAIAVSAIAGVNFFGTQLISSSAGSNGLGLPETPLGTDSIATILQMVFGLAGGVALVVITLAGFKYTVSQGDPSELTKAKNTIMYALIGLIVCIAAFSIVAFVSGNI